MLLVHLAILILCGLVGGTLWFLGGFAALAGFLVGLGFACGCIVVLFLCIPEVAEEIDRDFIA